MVCIIGSPFASVFLPVPDRWEVSKQAARKEALGRSAPLLPSTPGDARVSVSL